jgi:hypothetical protein
MFTSEPGGPSRLQSARLVAAVAELTSLGRKMTTPRRLIGVACALALFLAVVVVLWTRHPSDSQPLAVIVLGYTNGLGVSAISNQCSRTLWVWAQAYVEIAPFNATNRWTDWISLNGPSNRYLKPGETIPWTFAPTWTQTGTPHVDWRFRIAWSEEYRTRIGLWARQHNIRPVWLRSIPEYYAASAVITE